MDIRRKRAFQGRNMGRKTEAVREVEWEAPDRYERHLADAVVADRVFASGCFQLSKGALSESWGRSGPLNRLPSGYRERL